MKVGLGNGSMINFRIKILIIREIEEEVLETVVITIEGTIMNAMVTETIIMVVPQGAAMDHAGVTMAHTMKATEGTTMDGEMSKGVVGAM